MEVSNTLIAALKGFEGCRLTAYKCPAGVWTIGVGHTKGVKQGQVITKVQADVLLKGDLLPIVTYLNRIKKDWTQGQFDACVDFIFNLGQGAFDNSTLLRKILSKASTKEIQAQFRVWNKARVNGKLVALAGLTKRREWEARRWAE